MKKLFLKRLFHVLKTMIKVSLIFLILNFHFSNNKTKTFNKAEFGSIILYEGPKYAGKLISAPTGPTNNVQFNQIINFYSKLKKKKIK